MMYLRLLLVAILLTGCGLISEDKNKKVISPLPSLEHKEVTLTKQWSVSVGDIGTNENRLKLDPFIKGNNLFATSADGRIYAINKTTGDVLWKHDIGIGVSGSVAADEEMVVVSDENATLHALSSASGADLWTAQSTSEVLSNAAFSRDAIVVQSVDAKLQSFDRSTGAKKWTYSASQPALTLRGNASPVIDENAVIAAFDNGKIVAIDAATGILRWEERFIIPDGRSELERVVDVQEDPVVSGAHVYVGAYQGSVAALSVVTGDVLWDKKASVLYSMAEDSGHLYFIDGKDVVKSVYTTDGSVAWENNSFENRHISSPVVVDGYVVFGDEEGYLHVLSADNGKYVGQYHVGSGGISLGVIADESSVYVLANNGTQFAFKILKN